VNIWLKTKYDHVSGMDIPHNHNFASAMYGFREFGYEIVPYKDVKEIYDWVTRDDIVIDYIGQVDYILNKFDVKAYVPDYPDVMKKFLGRNIWEDTIDSIYNIESKWSAGNFVKPKKDKMFTGKVVKSIGDLVGLGNQNENYEVFVSEPVDFVAEWRGFIMYDKLIDLRPYGMLAHGMTDQWKYHYDEKTIEEMMEAFLSWKDRPVACSMDIGVTSDGRTLLVEFNDAYSLGSYGLADIYYAKLISARWSQLLNRPDIFVFN